MPYQRETATYVCERCGTSFVRVINDTTRSKHLYCSSECSNAVPWNKGKGTTKTIELTCEKCGKPFQRTVWQAEHALHHYCSRKCAYMKLEGKHLPPEHVEQIILNHAHLKGENSPVWQGGRYIDSHGYVRINIDGEIFHEHRLVMEQHLGRKLTEEEEVHHINFDKQDNRIENLQLFKSKSEHIAFHRRLESIENQ
jgi:DNA-directed RNA polymerase subunit RPC12/RpoP